jgi:hypothetical protein
LLLNGPGRRFGRFSYLAVDRFDPKKTPAGSELPLAAFLSPVGSIMNRLASRDRNGFKHKLPVPLGMKKKFVTY